MRKFFSYGQLDTDLHYYVPRTGLIEKAYTRLLGEHPEKGGHYITVWAPRQSGKSWVMLQVTEKLKTLQQFDIAILTMESAKQETSGEIVLEIFCKELQRWFRRDLPIITSWNNFSDLFTPEYFSRPLILILDEMDALEETVINKFASEFRKMYTARLNEPDTPTHKKNYVLHGLAFIGVRSVLGIENVKGSPFNVQHSLHIPNLTHQEVHELFAWYAHESGQQVEQTVIEQIYYETNGQPGLTCWFGELLSEGVEGYQPCTDHPITPEDFSHVLLWATKGLPNSNILNLISKAKHFPYKHIVLDLFRTSDLSFEYI